MDSSGGAATVLSSSQEMYSWKPLVATAVRVKHIWSLIEALPEIVADEPQFKDWKSFIHALSSPRSLFYEVGDDVGLVSISDVIPRLSGTIKFAFFDHKLRGKEAVVREIADDTIRKLKLERLTAMEPSKRETTCNFLMRCGFKLEGVMRRGYRNADGSVSDLCVLGLVM